MSIVTVTTATVNTKLVSLADLKTELGITGSTQDAYLGDLLDQTQTTIQSYLKRTLWLETVSEVFRDEEITNTGPMWLARSPTVTITSVTVDGTLLAGTKYEVDRSNGALYRLDDDGDRLYWQTGSVRKIVVVYSGGYSAIPLDIQRSALDLTKSRYYAQLRDPALKEVDIPGVIKESYWVGQVGTEVNGIPSTVASSLDTYRNLGVW